MAQYNIGTLSSDVASYNNFTLTAGTPNDIFGFDIANSRNINLYLHNISGGDDADLYLYQDSNGNGILDTNDTLVASSYNYNNANEVIDYAATAGTYFVQVHRWNPGSTGLVNYDLDLSATYEIGPLDSSVVSRNNYYVYATDPTDVFEISVDSGRYINLYLHNITPGDDADLTLYWDSNNNGIFDADDIAVAGSYNAGSNDDVIDYNAAAGTYFVEVNRYAPGSAAWAGYDLDLAAIYDAGALSGSVLSYSDSVNANHPTDVARITLDNSRDINLYLHNISVGDDVDLTLYQDSNNNGIFDADDVAVVSSNYGGNSDEVIDYSASAGTYFVEISRYGLGSTGSVDYDIDLSSVYDVGQLSGSTISRNNYALGANDPTDVFSFTLNNTRDIDLYLHNISAGDDADLTLYRDSNSNGVFDADDLAVAISNNWGNSNETISYEGTSGTYFVQVNRYAPGSTGPVSYDLDLSSSYDLGNIGAAPVDLNSYMVPGADPTDLFKFSIGTDRNINLSLHDISAGDDVDVRLFSDYNNNGIFDATDAQFGELAVSRDGSNNDEAINVRAAAGTYFAQVERYSGTGAGQYDLDISATFTSNPSNLLPEEVYVGDLNGDRAFYGNMSNANTSDIYSFSLDFYEGVNISMTGLSADADIRLIQDYNGNRQVDTGEVIQSSARGGSLSEYISNVTLSGNYLLQVYQYNGNTGHTVNFDHYTTVFA